MDKKQFCRCFFDLFFFFPKYTFFSDYYIILYSHGHVSTHVLYSIIYTLLASIVILRIYQWNNVIKG